MSSFPPRCTARCWPTRSLAVFALLLSGSVTLRADPAQAMGPGTPRSTQSAPSASERIAVFGADDRLLLPRRLSALEGKIGLLYESRSRSICTAFCVDDAMIATAAHCLFRTRGERALPLVNMSFQLSARKKSNATGIAGASRGASAQHVLAGSTSLSVHPPIDATKDWALVRLAQPVCKGSALRLSRRSPSDLASPGADRQVYQVGYHGDFGSWRLTLSPPCVVRRTTPVANEKSVALDFSDASALILHTCDTGGASSGSPLLMDGPNGPEVVGINVGTYLQSRVLTQAGAIVRRYKAEMIANTAVSTAAFRDHCDVFAAADLLTTRKQLRDVQDALTAAGHYEGPRDGRYGPQLRVGIEAFERSERRPPTGIASAALLKRLSAVMAGRRAVPPVLNDPLPIETGSVGSTAPSSATVPANR